MHVFLFICLSRFSFRFILFCVLRFIIISLLHFAAFASRCCSGTKNSMEILFFSFFFFFISFRFGCSWGPQKVDSHSRGSDNYFCIQTTRITYQQVALPTVPPSLSLERCCPISFGFWEPVSHFLSSQFGFRFFFFVLSSFFVVFDFTLFFLYAVVKFLPCCVAMPRRIYQHLIG